MMKKCLLFLYVFLLSFPIHCFKDKNIDYRILNEVSVGANLSAKAPSLYFVVNTEIDKIYEKINILSFGCSFSKIHFLNEIDILENEYKSNNVLKTAYVPSEYIGTNKNVWASIGYKFNSTEVLFKAKINNTIFYSKSHINKSSFYSRYKENNVFPFTIQQIDASFLYLCPILRINLEKNIINFVTEICIRGVSKYHLLINGIFSKHIETFISKEDIKFYIDIHTLKKIELTEIYSGLLLFGAKLNYGLSSSEYALINSYNDENVGSVLYSSYCDENTNLPTFYEDKEIKSSFVVMPDNVTLKLIHKLSFEAMISFYVISL